MLLELGVEVLSQTCGTGDEFMKQQKLYLSLFELFKATLFYLTQHGYYLPLFSKCEELSEVPRLGRYPCYIVHTFQVFLRA